MLWVSNPLKIMTSDINRRTFLKRTGTVSGGAAATALAGCTGSSGGSGSQGTSGGQTTIRLLTSESSPTSKKAFRGAFDEWAETVDADVNRQFQFSSADAFQQQISAGLATGDLPDILFGGITSVLNLSDSLVDVSDTFGEIGLAESWKVEIDGQTKFLPLSSSLNVRWNRNDLVEEAGLSYPETWDENVQFMQSFNEHLGDEMAATTISANSNSSSSFYYVMPDFLSNGARFLKRTEDGSVEVALGDDGIRQRAIETMEYLGRLGEHSLLGTDYGFSDLTGSFANEVAASVRYPGRLPTIVSKQAPELLEHTKATVMPASPAVQNGDQAPMYFATANGFAVSKDSANAGLVKDFLSYLFTSDAYLDLILAAPLHRVPSKVDAMNSDRFQNNSVVAAQQDYVELIEEHLDKITWFSELQQPPVPYWFQVCMGSQVGYKMFSNALTKRKDPATNVDDATSELKSILSEVKQSQSN